ncbi:hypothetical protein OBBRIDRAFT_796727 [Obba rivulosa]|uniref:BTB domain-containing protein n=1 Tax=Obba rivulosa TaxID=1052685 RepID=A0A8E2DLI4_9APHY|nr:hypothetical protein OBBRIDRAFT_796727 [Obba rivulosa]
MSQDCNLQIHPSFTSADADIVLSSHDSVHFRIHSQLLRHISGWFRTLLSLPNNAPRIGAPDILQLDETANVLGALLCIASGMKIPSLRPVDFCEQILLAAEKYEMPGPISVLRIALTSSLLDAPPLRVYAIAGRRDWIVEAKAASARTLSLDLFDPALRSELCRIDAPYLMKLLQLHHDRKEALRKSLEDVGVFTASKGSAPCYSCTYQVDHIEWFRFKQKLLARRVVPSDLLDDRDLETMSQAVCRGCNKLLYNSVTMMRNLTAALRGLPSNVELP